MGALMSGSNSPTETENNENQEIDLIDLFAVLLKNKVLIIVITLLSMLGVLAFSLISLVLPPESSPLPNKYTPKAHMLINDASSSGGGMSSMLASSGLGSLASMAGVNVPGGSTYSALAVFLASSDSFLDLLIEEFDLVARYEVEKSPKANTRKALKEALSASFDDDSERASFKAFRVRSSFCFI